MTDENPTIDVDELQLDDVVGMDPADLTDTHKEYLESNKQNLTSDQQVKFGFSNETPPDETPPKDDKEDAFDPNKIDIGVKKSIAIDFDNDDDDDMDSEERARINKQVLKGNKGLLERQQEYEDRSAINNVISEKPELRKYVELAYRYMKAHPSLVAEDAMKIASAGDQQRIGAIKEREASERAKKTANPGSSYRASSGGAKDWGKADANEVEAQIAFAKGQRS